jgi:hypothetical protein|tara:strand:+ start:50 stop:289 length:240 start_codon:yes stop_codon:yes gene_type:complete
VVARLPELAGQSADLVAPKEAKGDGKGGKGDKKKSNVTTSEDNKPAKVEEVGKPGAKGEKLARVCLDTVLDACLQVSRW